MTAVNPSEQNGKAMPHWMFPFISRHENFHEHYNALYHFMNEDLDAFRGFAMTEAKDGGYLGILKRYGPEGGLQVMFAAGETPFQLLHQADLALQSDRWKEDKPWVAGDKKK